MQGATMPMEAEKWELEGKLLYGLRPQERAAA
jgi:hypothetical protein